MCMWLYHVKPKDLQKNIVHGFINNTSQFSVIYNYVGHSQMFQDDVQVAYCCSYVQLLYTACG